MARLAGVDIPREKRVIIALTYIYGVGKTRAEETLAATGIDPNIRVKDLSDDQLVQLREAKLFRPADHDGVRPGNVETALHDIGRQQNVGLTFDKAHHAVVKLVGGELAMQANDAELRGDRLHARQQRIVVVEHLRMRHGEILRPPATRGKGFRKQSLPRRGAWWDGCMDTAPFVVLLLVALIDLVLAAWFIGQGLRAGANSDEGRPRLLVGSMLIPGALLIAVLGAMLLVAGLVIIAAVAAGAERAVDKHRICPELFDAGREQFSHAVAHDGDVTVRVVSEREFRHVVPSVSR